ncbi:hypothetical protein CBR_g4327 [Chara braunii]|uniref:CCHC-type domain-containing protein n=1 Tax=Chara braunii TaxID=69332 RepID=A0A388JRB9_CHABU|nr:hypothetical protein CBR_g4327 [Chara braunii]|eukprot:GBG60369.1 hypothetical protein CBR_g4327 [Chara braunii]
MAGVDAPAMTSLGALNMGGQGGIDQAMGGLGPINPVMQGIGVAGQQGAAPGSGVAAQYGVVTCYICGKNGHYARNCWQATNRQRPEGDNSEMWEILLRIGRREKEEEERKKREIDEVKRKEEEERREGEKLMEEQAREAKLEATIVRILTQQRASLMVSPTPLAGSGIKKSPHSKARMLRDITSYIAQSEDDSDDVKKEAEQLIEALESRRKPKQGAALMQAAVNRAKKVPTSRIDKAQVDNLSPSDEGFVTPKKACPAECSSKGKTFESLCTVFEQIDGSRQSIDVESTAGEYWLDSWKPIGEKYGESLVTIGIVRVKLKEARQRIQAGCRFTVTRVSMSTVRDIVIKIITRSVMDECIRSLVIERLRIVRLKGRTVGSIIHNYRLKLERRSDMCTCVGLDVDRFQGHAWARLDDVKGVHRFLHNSKNITCGRSLTTLQLVEIVVQAVPKGWRYNSLHVTNEEVMRCFAGDVPRSVALTEQEVKWEVRHVQDLVLVPLDRNPGATLVFCPVLYFHAFRMMFRWSVGFNPKEENEEQILTLSKTVYKAVGLPSFATWRVGFNPKEENEEQILTLSKTAYKAVGLPSLATWRTCRRLGRAYIIPKDKDYSRWRPISPSWSEPSRTASARLGRALRYMLLCLPAACHFSLRSRDQLKKMMLEGVASIQRAGNTIIGRSYDIKDMFARLPHDGIVASVRWISQVHEDRGLVGVKLSIRGKCCKIARTRLKEIGYLFFSFEQLMHILVYELQHTYTVCENQVYQQFFGVPMGKHSSPALANLLCAKAEYFFLGALGVDRRLVTGVRMVDDASILTVFYHSNHDSYIRALEILDWFSECYSETLKLVRKDDGNNAWDFLGSRVILEPCPPVVHILPRTKNQMSIVEYGVLHYHSMHDFSSYSAKKVKRMTLTASMLRIRKSSTDEAATLASIICLLKEAGLRDYFPEVFFGSLARFAKVVGCTLGSSISQMYPHRRHFGS